MKMFFCVVKKELVPNESYLVHGKQSRSLLSTSESCKLMFKITEGKVEPCFKAIKRNNCDDTPQYAFYTVE